MKKIFILLAALCCAATTSAQSIVRAGFYMDNGQAVLSNPMSTIYASVTVQTTHFTPGEFARYAQKLLGVRASLAEHTNTQILSTALYSTPFVTVPQHSATPVCDEVALPDYRISNRAMTLEQQAEAAAEMIFSLRRHRKELITGEAGENVFGAGLTSALAEIEAMEQQCLSMFYGTTTVKMDEYRYTLTPATGEANHILCRYREGVGVVPISDLSGTPIMVVITAEQVDTSSLPIATDRDKSKAEFAIAAKCKVELLCGTDPLASLDMPMFQFGKRVVLVTK